MDTGWRVVLRVKFSGSKALLLLVSFQFPCCLGTAKNLFIGDRYINIISNFNILILHKIGCG